MEKYWEESGYKDEEKRYNLDRSSTGNFADQFCSDQDDTKDGKEVIVTVDGKEVYKTSIKKDQIYQIPEKNGTNVMQIKDGKVTMKKQTVKTRSVQTIKQSRNQGETIVCLPHKVVIEIRSEDGKRTGIRRGNTINIR